jgi:Protein of unknown function (DUF2934)
MPVSKEHAVRQLAYRLWAARGGQHGFDLQDWLDAERLIGDSDDPRPRSDNSEPPIKVPNPPEDEGDDVIPETPKVASRDAPGG